MTEVDLISRWKRSTVLRPRLISICHLLSGNFADALIMLAGVAIAARGLGPAEYGAMVLVLTYVRIVERMIRFESWQALIRFAANVPPEAGSATLSRLYAYGLVLDVSAAVLAFVLAIGLSALFAPLLGFDERYVELIAIYSVAIAVNIKGMPTAAMRMAGRFRSLAYVQLTGSILRVVLAAICLVTGAGIYGFITAWTISQAAGALLFIWFGFRALRLQGIPSPLRVNLTSLPGSFPGFLAFAWSTNLSSTLRTMTQEADTLLVGWLGGPATAGFYHIAKRIAKVAQQVAVQVQAVIYPDVARLWAQGNLQRFRSTTLRVQAALGGVALTGLAGTWVLGEWLIMMGPGEEYGASYPLLVTQMIAVVLIMHAAPSRSALLAMGMHRFVLGCSGLGTALFFAVALFYIPRIGAMGANVAHIAFALVTAVLMDLAWLRGVRDRSTRAQVSVGG